MKTTNQILPIGDQTQAIELQRTYNQALGEKFNLEFQLKSLEIGNYGRKKLQVEIAKLTEVIIRADESIFVIHFPNSVMQKITKRKIQKCKKELKHLYNSYIAIKNKIII